MKLTAPQRRVLDRLAIRPLNERDGADIRVLKALYAKGLIDLKMEAHRATYYDPFARAYKTGAPRRRYTATLRGEG